MLLQIKPKPRPKDTRRKGEHFHWSTKMFIHETKQEPNKKISNSSIINQKHPTSTADIQTDKTRNMNININGTALERSVTNTGGVGKGLNRFYRALMLARLSVDIYYKNNRSI